MHLPLSFRVVSLHADEGSHSVDIQEIRGPVLLNQATTNGPQMPRAPESPPQRICLSVSPEQFAQLRIGQTFVLEPTPIAVEAVGGFLGQQQASYLAYNNPQQMAR